MRTALATLLLLSAASVAAAQLCVGNTDLPQSVFHGVVNVSVDKLAHLYTAELRYSYRALFASAEYGIKSWELTSLDGTSRATALSVGLRSSTRGHAKFEICPQLRWSTFSGPNEIEGSPWSYD